MKRIMAMVFLASLLFGNTALADLIGQWSFNGNANDTSGENHHGVVNNAVLTEDRFGNSNSAYFFDGSGDKIWIDDSYGELSPFDVSVSLWFRWDGRSPIYSTDYMLYKGTYSHYSVGIDDEPGSEGEIRAQSFWETPHSLYSGEPAIIGEWYHVVFTESGTSRTRNLYINGILTDTAGVSGPFTNNQPLIIGGYSNGNYDFWGAIDDISIYDHILAPSEIQQLYNPVPEPATMLLLGSGLIGLIGSRRKLKI